MSFQRLLTFTAACSFCSAGFADSLPVHAPAAVVSGAPRLAAGEVIADTALDPSGGIPAASASYLLKPGFAGQLYDALSLEASAQSQAVNEGQSTQLSAVAMMDDDTTMVLPAAEVTWSVISGPIASISSAGLASSAPVVGDRSAEARADALGLTVNTSITVLDSDRDNFGLVAGDGIDDAWQFEFFDADESGELDAGEATAAAPGANPDKDLHANFFEWASGHDPTNPSSFLRFQILSRTGTEARFQISKTIAGTTYAVERLENFEPGALRVDVAGLTETTDSTGVVLIDFNATAPTGFYRLRLDREP